MAPSLNELPVEILNCTVAHLDIARDLYHLSQTCKRLHEYVNSDGFRVFVKERFPSIPSNPAWRDAARHLTSVSRAWDRKAFVARQFEDPSTPGIVKWRRRRRSRTQTIGYRPVIDSYSEQRGRDWNDRRDVLVYGAGAKLFLRAKRSLNEAANSYSMKQVVVSKDGKIISHSLPTRFDDGASVTDVARLLGGDYHTDRLEESFKGTPGNHWLSHFEEANLDGLGDITSVNILRPSQKLAENTETCMVGRANGQLNRLEIDLDKGKRISQNFYDTSGQAVRSTDVNSGPEALLVAGLSQDTVTLYPLYPKNKSVSPLDNVSVASSDPSSVIHSTKFLSNTKIAAGIGHSQSPIRIFNVSPSGFDKVPLRSYTADGGSDPDYKIPEGSQTNPDTRKTVFCIAPVVGTTRPGGGEGDLFLSGWFDGTTRLHDLRSPAPYVSLFEDSLDSSPVSSILPIGRERLVVGSAEKPCVQVFDFRLTGGRRYFSAAADPCTESAANWWSFTQQDESCCNYHHEAKFHSSGYSMFITDSQHISSATRRPRRNTASSGVFSLSSPAPDSPTFYVGLEDHIVEVGVTENISQFADPLFEDSSQERPAGKSRSVKHNLFRRRRPPIDLVLYQYLEASDPRSRPQRYEQVPPWSTNDSREPPPGWDVRWTSNYRHPFVG